MKILGAVIAFFLMIILIAALCFYWAWAIAEIWNIYAPLFFFPLTNMLQVYGILMFVQIIKLVFFNKAKPELTKSQQTQIVTGTFIGPLVLVVFAHFGMWWLG